MKLKYYLRGLGIGILVTATILSISGKGHVKELTDMQIKSKAKELGMVEKNALSDTFEDTAKTNVKEEILQKDPAENENSISNNKISDEEPENAADTSKQIVENENINSNEEVMIKVESGESSLSISKKLEKAGLIKSASSFDEYLCQNSYDKNICIGEHLIAKDSTEEQIAKEITSK